MRSPSPLHTLLFTRIIAPVSALTLGLKLLRVLEHYAADSLLGALDLIASDLFFLTGLGALTLLWLAPYGLRHRVRTILLAQALWLPVLFIELAAQLFYITTGDVLSWSRLATYFEHVALLSGMVISAPPEGSLLLVGALMGLCGVSPWVWRRQTQGDTPHNPINAPRWLKASAPILCIVLSFAFPTRHIHQPFGRQATLRLAISSARAALPSSLVQGAPRSPRTLTPNAAPKSVILILLESTSARATSAYETTLTTTPTLAAQNALGTRIEQAFAVVPHTTTALYTMHCGAYPDFDMIPPEHGYAYPDCLPGLLREQGYQTAYFQGASLLFENNYAMLHHIGYNLTVGADNLEPTPFEPLNYFGYEEKALVEPGRTWLKNRDKEKPFLLTFMTLAPHHDYKLPKGYTPTKYHDDPEFNQYLNCVAYSDEFVKDLLDMLDEQGVLDDSIVAIVGDHGEGFGEHGRPYHDNVIYQEALRIPFLLRGPGVPKGAVIKEPASQLDLMPTLAALAGFTLDGDLDGVDLLDAHARAQPRELIAQCWLDHSCAALIAWPYKLTHHYGQKPDELFDLEHDPHERTDLIKASRVPSGLDLMAMRERLLTRLTSLTTHTPPTETSQ